MFPAVCGPRTLIAEEHLLGDGRQRKLRLRDGVGLVRYFFCSSPCFIAASILATICRTGSAIGP